VDTGEEDPFRRLLIEIVGVIAATVLAIYLRHRFSFFRAWPATTHFGCLAPLLYLAAGKRRNSPAVLIPLCVALVIMCIWDYLDRQASPPVSPIVFVLVAGGCLALLRWRLAKHAQEQDRQQEQADHLWDQNVS
jgi:hypothetical protein